MQQIINGVLLNNSYSQKHKLKQLCPLKHRMLHNCSFLSARQPEREQESFKHRTDTFQLLLPRFLSVCPHERSSFIRSLSLCLAQFLSHVTENIRNLCRFGRDAQRGHSHSLHAAQFTGFLSDWVLLNKFPFGFTKPILMCSSIAVQHHEEGTKI